MTWMLIVTVGCYILGSSLRPLLAAGLAMQLAYMALRGIALGRLPLIGPHDTLLFFSASLALMSLITSLSGMMRRERWFPLVSGMLAGLFALLALLFPPVNMPLPPVLDTTWFELHVVLAFFGYALFAVGGIASAAYLVVKERRFLDVLFKTALAGWTFFSASMIAGGIWGYYAWGTYWLWTPKELWTSVLWLFYSLLLHVRLKGVAWDRAAAWLGITGAFVMLFTYLGVSMLMRSSHSF